MISSLSNPRVSLVVKYHKRCIIRMETGQQKKIRYMYTYFATAIITAVVFIISKNEKRDNKIHIHMRKTHPMIIHFLSDLEN